MGLARWLMLGILVSASLMVGGVSKAEEVPLPSDEKSMDPANVLGQWNERLHVPQWPGAEPPMVAATYRDGAVDWVYYEPEVDAVMLLLAGQGDPVTIFDEWGGGGGAERSIYSLSAAWLKSGELHVYIAEARQMPIIGANEMFGFHIWWSGAGGGFETLDPPGLPDLWDFFATGLRSDGDEVTLALGSFWLTDLLLPTGLEAGTVYTTRGGAFEAETRLNGYKVERAIPWNGDVVACGGRNANGEVAIARRSTDWEWEPVSTSAAAMPSCDIAAAEELKVFFYGFPAIGGGGNGEPGSGDSTEYQVAHWRNDTWEVENLHREPYRGQWFMATPHEHYIVFYSPDGEHNQETLVHTEKGWTVGLSVDRGDPGVVTQAPNPMMLVESARSDRWSHDGWAALELMLR